MGHHLLARVIVTLHHRALRRVLADEVVLAYTVREASHTCALIRVERHRRLHRRLRTGGAVLTRAARTLVAGFANGVCEYDFISEYTAECTVMESDDNSGEEVVMSGWGEAVDGWEGLANWTTTLSGNCDIDVIECASSPCQNGATCTESTVESSVSFHAYQCTCVAGFANGVCEYDFISEYTAECTVMESDDNSGAELVMSGWG